MLEQIIRTHIESVIQVLGADEILDPIELVRLKLVFIDTAAELAGGTLNRLSFMEDSLNTYLKASSANTTPTCEQLAEMIGDFGDPELTKTKFHELRNSLTNITNNQSASINFIYFYYVFYSALSEFAKLSESLDGETALSFEEAVSLLKDLHEENLENMTILDEIWALIVDLDEHYR